jgi:hypothetical protein
MKNNTLLTLGMFEKPPQLIHFQEPKTSGIISDISVIRSFYDQMPEQIDGVRMREELFKQFKETAIELNLEQYNSIGFSSPSIQSIDHSESHQPSSNARRYVSKAADFVKDIISEFRNPATSKVLVTQF